MQTILIVEDSDVDATLYARFLQSVDDVRSVRCETIEGALAYAATQDVALVILDLYLPDGDGFDFLHGFRKIERHAQTPIVMTTIDLTNAVRHRALVDGATDFLTKPVDAVEFVARIRNLLELHRSRVALADRAAWLQDEVDHAMDALRVRERETVYRLTRAAEFRDTETGMHLARMAHYGELLAQALGSNASDSELIFLAAPMHDVGKVGITDDVLLKPGRHTPREQAIMRQHSEIGYEILKDSPSPLVRLGADIALAHHERFDGLGYPHGMAGETIPLAARITAISDVFDALTSKRVYKSAWPVEAAVREIDAGRGSFFDPRIVDAFHEVLPEMLVVKSSYADSEEARVSA